MVSQCPIKKWGPKTCMGAQHRIIIADDAFVFESTSFQFYLSCIKVQTIKPQVGSFI